MQRNLIFMYFVIVYYICNYICNSLSKNNFLSDIKIKTNHEN